MEGLLLVQHNGGRTAAAAKIIASGIFLAGISVWFACMDFIGFVLAFGTLEGLGMPVYAISDFAAASLSVSVGVYAIISALARTLGIWAAGMLLLLTARFGKNALYPFLSGLFVCLGMVVLGSDYADSGYIWIKVLNPFSLIQSRILLGRTEFVNVAGFPVPGYAAAAFFAVLLGIWAAAAILFSTGRNKHCFRGRAGS